MIYRLAMPATFVVFSVGLLLSPLGASPAWPQSVNGQSVEEMAENFKKQKTRGLVIATPESDNSTATEGTQASAEVEEVDIDEMATAVPEEERVYVNIAFDFDSAALREDQKPKLASLCAALKAADVKMIRILGHTDASGSVEYNERLSKLRAEEVKRHLTSNCGFPAERMDAQGVG